MAFLHPQKRHETYSTKLARKPNWLKITKLQPTGTIELLTIIKHNGIFINKDNYQVYNGLIACLMCDDDSKYKYTNTNEVTVGQSHYDMAIARTTSYKLQNLQFALMGIVVINKLCKKLNSLDDTAHCSSYAWMWQ